KARNLCLERFEGDYLLFWDSDVIPPKNLLRRMVSMLENDRSLGMIGADYVYQKQDRQVGVFGKVIRNKRTHAVWMGFTLIRRDVFELIGGFNELLDVGEDTEFGIKVAEGTDFRTMWGPQPVLHLRPPAGKRSSDRSFTQWLSYNFRERGDKYAKAFRELPLLLRMRIFYYGPLPVVLALSLVLAYYVGFLAVLIFIAYLLPGWYLSIRGSDLRRGTLSFFLFNMPTGIALSYGVLRHVLKHSEK
ncbi:MAG: glycosyltransferase family 2 protein, partial [Thermoplasmata archaeon]|nr:glycosyltransferase family 2 protein [Thermoplasmata archaeon]